VLSPLADSLLVYLCRMNSAMVIGSLNSLSKHTAHANTPHQVRIGDQTCVSTQQSVRTNRRDQGQGC
jgi:hypothetical protein